MSTARKAGSIVVGAGAVAAYLLVYRPWQLRWGATDEEVSRSMPGDDMVERPMFSATRAVTVNAAPEYIWPWLVQMGLGRAGWYSYDWIDNLGRPSAERIIPELQSLKVGDLIPISPDRNQGLWVRSFDKNRSMLWSDETGDVTWCWGLYPLDERRTRLVSRVRARYLWRSLPQALFNVLLETGDIVMMRKCLIGIKGRAEALARQPVKVSASA